jgi:uncharacterized membrane protein
MASAALLFGAGQLFERPIFGREFRLKFDGTELPIVIFSTVLLLAGQAVGGVGYGGINVGEGGHISPIAAVLMWWCVPAFAYSICATLNTVGLLRWAVGACTLIQTVAMVPFGRRIFTSSLVLALITMRLGGYRFRMSFIKKVLVGVLGIALVLTASIGFLYLRFASWENHEKHKNKAKLSLGTQINLALEIMQKRTPAEVLQYMQTSVSTRTFMLGYLADLVDASQQSPPLLGSDMLRNLQLAVPSVFSKDKFAAGDIDEEHLVDLHWGFTFTDEANSLLTAGAADFGLIGVLVYPLLIIFFLRFTLERLQWVLPALPSVIIALSFVFETLQAEDSPIGYFIAVRNSLMMGLLFYFVYWIPKFRWRR